jgi:hypothetical protein
LIVGEILKVPTGRATFTLGVWNAQSAVHDAWPENGFADVSGLASVTMPVRAITPNATSTSSSTQGSWGLICEICLQN